MTTKLIAIVINSFIYISDGLNEEIAVISVKFK
jgi:hypothetical protein